jgi:subtilisin family serine protease
VTPDPRGATAVLLAALVVLAGVPAGALAADPADGPAGDDGAADPATGPTGGAETADGGVVDGTDRDGEPDDTHGGDADDPSDDADGDDADAREARTLTYRGVEFTVETPVDDRTVSAASAVSPLGAPVDGDRYLVHVVVVSDDPAHEAAIESLGAEVHLRVGRHVEVLATLGTIERLRAAPFVVAVRPPQYLHRPDPVPPTTDRDGDGLAADLRAATAVRAATAGPVVSEGVARIGADRVHARGITGAGVAVGVVDSGFDPANSEYADSLVAYRSFTPGGRFDGFDGVHGTGVTELVADVAPDARIYYAEVATGPQFAAAVEWLEDEGVAVVSSSWYFVDHPDAPYGWTALADRAYEDATDSGVVTVATAGNFADSYWTGPSSDRDGDGVHEFDATGTELALLNDGWGFPSGGTFQSILYFEGYPDTTTDYRIVLHERTGPTTVAKLAVGDFTRGLAWENVVFTLPSGTGPVFLGLERVDGAEPEWLRLHTVGGPSNDVATAAGSIVSPGTARGTITVGAYDQRSGRLTGYSSHGPTDDGRRGVDVLGPSHVSTTAYEGYSRGPWGFSGTSAAQPHVAGVAALLLQADPTLSPADVERVLTETAVDAGAPGADTRTGYGYVDADAAVRAALGETPVPDRTPPSSAAPTGQWTVLFTDPDEPSLPVDLARVSAQHDAETLYLRYEFHGDYAADSVVWARAVVDADRDATTGTVYDPGALGAEYAAFVSPWQYEFDDHSMGALVHTGVPATYFAPDYAGDAHVVGVSRASLGDPEAVDLAFRGQYGPVDDDWVYDFVPNAGSVTYEFDDVPTPVFTAPVPGSGEAAPPTDPDDDGLYEDVDGDGDVDFDDAVALAFVDASELTPGQVTALDFDRDGDVDFDDAVELAFLV